MSNVQAAYMTDLTDRTYFSKKHIRLHNIASVANIFSWITLVVFTLSVVASFISSMNFYAFQYSISPPYAIGDYLELFRADPLRTANIAVNLLSTLIQGVIYWLILKGISLGLKMIVEIDLNYLDRSGVTNRG
jgi:hypothetical protein